VNLRPAHRWRGWLLLGVLLLAASTPRAESTDDGVPRHPLELQALTDPDQVTAELPAARARAAKEPDTLALLALAEANVCRIRADWLCQRRAGAEAVELATRAGEPQIAARGLILESRALIGLQDYSRAEQLLAEAQNRLGEIGAPVIRADIKLGWSSLSHALGKHQLAADYAEQGLALLANDQALAMRARLQRNLARALAQLGQQEAARSALAAGLADSLRVDDPKLSAELHLESARLAHQASDVAAQRRHAEAVLGLAEHLRNSQLFGQGHEVLALAAMQAGEHAAATRAFETAIASFKNLGLYRDELRASRSLIGLLLEHDRSKDLRPLLRRQLSLQDQVSIRDRAQAADDFEARLAYAQQQLDVLRLEAEAQLASERSLASEAQARLSRATTLASLGALLLLGLLLGLQLRANRRVLAALAELRRSEARASELLRLSAGLVLLHDLDGNIELLNPAAARALHIDAETPPGRLQDHVAAEAAADLDRYLGTMRATGTASQIIAFSGHESAPRLLRLDGRRAADDGHRAYVIGHATDITADVRAADALRAQALNDALTGCYNRRYLEQFESRASAQTRWAVVNIDLDGFKQVNDRHGHERGDAVLREFAQFLRQQVRDVDAVVRVGGDEFLILLPEAQPASLDALLQRLHDAQSAAPCRYSTGSALREGNESLDATLGRADAQMYARRRAARGESAESAAK